MVSFVEMSHRGRSFTALVTILRAGRGVNMREFCDMTDYVQEAAEKLRDQMEAWGHIRVSRTKRGFLEDIEITLTEEGRTLALLLEPAWDHLGPPPRDIYLAPKGSKEK